MIKKTKTYEVLEEQDVERLVSEQLGKPPDSHSISPISRTSSGSTRILMMRRSTRLKSS